MMQEAGTYLREDNLISTPLFWCFTNRIVVTLLTRNASASTSKHTMMNDMEVETGHELDSDPISSQVDAPDPTKIKIKIKDHDVSFIVDRQTAINNSLYFERIMSGPWANSRTGVVELEEGDHATPDTVRMFIRYLEYAADPEGGDDPLDEIDDFDTYAKVWLFADYIQSNLLANAIMDEIASKADGSDEMWMSVGSFKFWWHETDARPSLANLRGVMLAMLVNSGHFTEDARRHELMASLPADAQQAVVDEFMRQHRDVVSEISSADAVLREHLDAEGRRELSELRARMNQQVVAADYYAKYGI